jgi:hypothetical protein
MGKKALSLKEGIYSKMLSIFDKWNHGSATSALTEDAIGLGIAIVISLHYFRKG